MGVVRKQRSMWGNGLINLSKTPLKYFCLHPTHLWLALGALKKSLSALLQDKRIEVLWLTNRHCQNMNFKVHNLCFVQCVSPCYPVSLFQTQVSDSSLFLFLSVSKQLQSLCVSKAWSSLLLRSSSQCVTLFLFICFRPRGSRAVAQGKFSAQGPD